MAVTVVVRSRVPAYTAAAIAKVGAATSKAVFDIEAQAKARAPVDTGFLRSAIEGSMTGTTSGVVVSNAHYSIFQEFGTYRMAARPYMVPAVEMVVPVYKAAVQAALR